MNENVSVIHQSAFNALHDQVKKLSSFGFKSILGDPEQDPKIWQSIERGDMTFVYLSPESELTTERWRNTFESEFCQESLIGRRWMKYIVLPNGAVQATTRIIQLSVCGISVTLAILIMPL